MEYKNSYVFFLTSLYFFVACSDSNVLEQYKPSIMGHYLTISRNNFSYMSEGGTQTADITTNSTPWIITDNPSWLTVSPSKGANSTSVDFTVLENLSSDTTRTCVFYLKSNDESWTYRSYLSAYQAAASPYLNVSKTSLVFAGSASTQIVDISSNTKYSAVGADEWVKAKVADDGTSIDISVEENLSGMSRTSTISLIGSINKTINITQQAADMTGETSTLSFGCEGGTRKVSFNSETAWTSNTSSSWIDVSPESGTSGSNHLLISTVPNSSTSERTDYVYLKIGSQVKLQIPIRQDGIYIRTDVSNLTFDSFASERSLSIESNTDWEILSYPNWIVPSETSNKGDKTIKISASENPDTKERIGVIKIGQKGFSYSIEVRVEQTAMSIYTDKDLLQFSDIASATEFILITEGTWSAYTSDAWIHVSPSSGFGNASINISVDENVSESERNGIVFVKVGNMEKQIKIVQSGKYFSYTNDNLEVGSTGGIISLSLKTNETWSVSKASDASWISLSETYGYGDANIFINIADNPSIKGRTSTVTVAPANSPIVTLSINQAARYLTVNCTSLTFFAKGGTSDAITISTDGTFSITKDQEWITINQNGKTFTVTASQSSLLESRAANITVKLTGLVNKDSYSINIVVLQKAVSEKFDGNDFDEDENWN